MESLNRMYLGELLYSQWKPVLLRRVLRAKSKLIVARAEKARGSISEWDYSNLANRYRDLRETYTDLNPEELRSRYFSAPVLSEYPTVFTDLEAVCTALRRTGGRIKILHPLEHGLDPAYRVILGHAERIDFVEVYNMYDSINRSVDDILRFARFINVLNSGRSELVRPFLEGHDLQITDAELPRVVAAVASRPIFPVCGSDSTGRSTTIPGMGFITRSRLIGPRRRRYLEKHFALPQFVSRIITARGSSVGVEAESGAGGPRHQHGEVHTLHSEQGRRRDRCRPHPLGPRPALPQPGPAQFPLHRERDSWSPRSRSAGNTRWCWFGITSCDT